MTTAESGDGGHRGPSPQPLRIAVLSWRDVHHPEAGGSEVYVHEVARRWVAAGHEVTVVTARAPGQDEREVVDGVVHRRRGGRLTVYPHGLLYLLRAGRALDVVIDVINGLPFGSPLVRRQGVMALVHHVHREQWQIIYPDWRGRIGWFVESWVTPRLYRRVPFVTVSAATRADLAGIGVPPDHVAVVRNGLSAHPVEEVVRSHTPRVIVLTRLVPHKQVEHVLEAAARLRGEHPDLAIDVVGDGWWHDRLIAEAERLGVCDMVTFHGHVDELSRDRLLAQAWVMALPSLKEGWGIAVTEAAAQGTPTIGYVSSGGLQESVVDGVTGWLVDDLDELVERLDSVLSGRVALGPASTAARESAAALDWSRTSTELLHVAAGAARGAAVSGLRRR